MTQSSTSTTNEGRVHTVRQGESTTRLAYRNGLHWKTVWDHADNADLRELRGNANVLKPGDRIFIPHRRETSEACDTEQKHTFVRKGVPEIFRMRFLNEEAEPFADIAYRFTIDGHEVREGTLDADGRLEEPIQPDVRQALVELGEDGGILTTDVRLGELDPIDELTGVKERLRNLSYYDGPIDDRVTDLLNASIARFRDDHDLEPGDTIDDALHDAIEAAHGS